MAPGIKSRCLRNVLNNELRFPISLPGIDFEVTSDMQHPSARVQQCFSGGRTCSTKEDRLQPGAAFRRGQETADMIGTDNPRIDGSDGGEHESKD